MMAICVRNLDTFQVEIVRFMSFEWLNMKVHRIWRFWSWPRTENEATL